jgi:hypothetical protein
MADLADVLLAEYDAKNKEQASRIIARDSLGPLAMTASAALFLASAQPGRGAVLLAITLACTVLGLTCVAMDEKVTQFGRYVELDLEPRIRAAVGAPQCVLAWETRRNNYRPHGTSAKLRFITWNFSAFIVPPTAGTTTYIISHPPLPMLILAGLSFWLVVTTAVSLLRAALRG